METKDHLTLSGRCLESLGRKLPAAARLAFRFGNIEPDINPLTYLKKNAGKVDFRGHHFPNTVSSIRRLVKKLAGRRHFTVFDYFRWGVLMHYTADAFTFVHNRRFAGNLAEHGRYEAGLHLCFARSGDRSGAIDGSDAGSKWPEAVLSELYKLHGEYEAANRPDTERDYRFIQQAAAVLCTLVPQENPRYRRRMQKKRVMALTGRKVA